MNQDYLDGSRTEGFPVEKSKNTNMLYRVRFSLKDNKDPHELVVRHVYPSDLMGLVTLEGFVFKDQTKMVILPDEDEMSKRFGKTDKLHLPYHQLIYVEEFDDEPADVKNLPFVREVVLKPNPPVS